MEPARREELIHVATRASELAPRDHTALAVLGQAWKAVGELEKAHELWARSAELRHRRPEASSASSSDQHRRVADVHEGEFRDIVPVEAVNTPI